MGDDDDNDDNDDDDDNNDDDDDDDDDLSGLCIVAWIGFGGPKPPRSKLPVSVANCSLGGDTPLDMTLDPMMANMTVAVEEEEEEYFYLYRISYAWTSAIGFLVCVLVGVAVSHNTVIIHCHNTLS